MRCCNCSCFCVNDEFSRVYSCYPSNDSPQPVASRLSELNEWVEANNSRIATISDILINKIKTDINKKKINSTTVGMKIFLSFTKSNVIQTTEIVQNITSLVIYMINTQQIPFLQIAKNIIRPLILNTDKTQLKNLILTVVHAYIRNVSNIELNPIIFQSLSHLIDQISINLIPTDLIFPLISNQLINSHSIQNEMMSHDDGSTSEKDGVEKIIVSIAHSVTPVFLINFFESWITFLNTNHLWNEIKFIQTFMLITCNEMNDKCAPSFFKLWLDQLPPRSPDSGHCRTIIVVASYLLIDSNTQFKSLSSKLLSQTELDHSLMTLFMFYLHFPKLMYEDSKLISDLIFKLSQKVAVEISQYEIVKIVYVQIYSQLPIIADDEIDCVDYDPLFVSLIFQFLTMFNKAIGVALTRKMLNGSLKRLYFFLIRFIGHHDDSTLLAVVEYLKSISTDIMYRSAASECVIPFLLALQKGLKKIVKHENTSLVENRKSEKSNEISKIDEKRRSFSSSSLFLQLVSQPNMTKEKPRRKRSLSKNNSFLSPLKINHSKSHEDVSVISILELHTLIICSMIDSVQNLSNDVKEYVMSILQQRIEHRPILILSNLTISKRFQIANNIIDPLNYNQKDFFDRNAFPYIKKKLLLEKIILNDHQQMDLITQLIESIPDEEFLVSENIQSEVSYESEVARSENHKDITDKSIDSSSIDSQSSLSDET